MDATFSVMLLLQLQDTSKGGAFTPVLRLKTKQVKSKNRKNEDVLYIWIARISLTNICLIILRI